MKYRKSFLLSLSKCHQYNSYLPYVRDHNQFRYYRSVQENVATLTLGRRKLSLLIIDVSVRLTPQSYQRYEVYRILHDMRT